MTAADVTTVPGGTLPLPVHALDRLGSRRPEPYT
jgi:hypothetical protein